MIFTTLFGFFAAAMLGIPLWAWVVGFLCVLGGDAVLLFGLFMCIATDASISYYVVGFLCILFDAIIAAGLES